MHFLVNIHRRIGGTVVTVGGEIDISSRKELLDALVRATHRYDSHLLLDLSRVTFLDCAGLGALVRARQCAENNGGSLQVVAAGARVRRIIRLTGLQDLLLPPVEVIAAQRP